MYTKPSQSSVTTNHNKLNGASSTGYCAGVFAGLAITFSTTSNGSIDIAESEARLHSEETSSVLNALDTPEDSDYRLKVAASDVFQNEMKRIVRQLGGLGFNAEVDLDEVRLKPELFVPALMQAGMELALLKKEEGLDRAHKEFEEIVNRELGWYRPQLVDSRIEPGETQALLMEFGAYFPGTKDQHNRYTELSEHLNNLENELHEIESSVPLELRRALRGAVSDPADEARRQQLEQELSGTWAEAEFVLRRGQIAVVRALGEMATEFFTHASLSEGDKRGVRTETDLHIVFSLFDTAIANAGHLYTTAELIQTNSSSIREEQVWNQSSF